jgi:hypothetical protein
MTPGRWPGFRSATAFDRLSAGLRGGSSEWGGTIITASLNVKSMDEGFSATPFSVLGKWRGEVPRNRWN